MTRGPDFDDLVDDDVAGTERERLRKVHELLLQAGPPPELSPELLAAALVTLAIAFLAGYAVGNGNDNGLSQGRTLRLVGTKAAPHALASLRVQPVDSSGNWPMQIAVTGLPKLPRKGYYTVWLMRDGKVWAPCGTFVVADENHGVSVPLNAPYRLKPGDTWVVTLQVWGHDGAGPIVLAPKKSA
jgi:hypothetical protein